VRVRRVVILAAPYRIAGPCESRHGPAIGATAREATGVIEVQVRGDHQIDVVRRESVIGQGVIEVPPPIQAEDVGELGVQLVAHSSVDQDPPAPVADQPGPRGQPDAIPAVGRYAPLPERLGDDAEHGASVEREVAVECRTQFEPAESQGLTAHARSPGTSVRSCFSSTSTPPAAEGWMNATREP